MTGTAIALMLVAIVIIWGGLAVSVTALVSRGRREARDARRAAVAAAREHLGNAGTQG
ncbi:MULTISPECIES: methionine/alanine import family NSS transporter small subunit [unclassified Actinomyces]|uniref:methionine/alanine import family NSS transporter small subunit n=1 Tax=unclassified Actinomyces TaxID=2609248 RepID=UPI000D02D754|nr:MULTISPECIES: methionine/alanine import family NSS transporter small subunit [unclassified Actinomyces]AVM61426.1 MetS family NSS transporter small subunit [Actinomyces sp. oral taxon 897]QQO78120.1 methionine/alanine import family NSS transporter small subunit [Actinomyces sp. HMT897]